MKSKSLLIVISGPSGVGKGTVVKELIKTEKKLSLSVSATTRQPRSGEVEGINYFFKSQDEFLKMRENDEFLETFEIYGNHYGTPRKAVEKSLSEGRDVILEIDIQGGLAVKEKFDDALMIFILPPSLAELKSRLVGRKSETEESLNRRLSAAESEILTAKKYDYIVYNDCLSDAVCDIMKIIAAEKHRVCRNILEIENLIGG